MRGLDAAFTACDASLIEINSLAVTAAGDLLALDVKKVLDDNAQFRHADLAALRDEDEIDSAELEEHRYNLNYRSEEHTAELQSIFRMSDADFDFNKKIYSIYFTV